MAIQKIVGSDKLKTGFYVKYNDTVDEIIHANGSVDADGVLSFPLFGGGTRTADLGDRFYTKQEINNIMSGVLFGATQTTAGIVRLATENEAIELENGSAVITPATLGAVLDNLFQDNRYFVVVDQPITDFNEAALTGLYKIDSLSTLANRPTAATGQDGLLWSYVNDDSATQQYLDLSTGIYYTRNYTNDAWGAWSAMKDSTVPDYIREITEANIASWNEAAQDNNARDYVSSQSIQSGQLVNIHLVGGAQRVRLAVNTSADRLANGIALTTVGVGGSCRVAPFGRYSSLMKITQNHYSPVHYNPLQYSTAQFVEGITVGVWYYLSDNAGRMTKIRPTTGIVQPVGWGMSTNDIIVMPQHPLDPDLVPSWVKAITQAQIANWNLAHSWGNHGAQPYLRSDQTYANPAWLSSLGFSKILDVPSFARRDIAQTIDAQWTFASLPISSQTPTQANQLITKGYADSLSFVKRGEEVVTVSLTNITLSGTQTINGYAAQVGDRVLVAGQTTASQNGVYVVASGAWTRSTLNDSDEEIRGAYHFITNGNAAGARYINTNTSVITVGTTAINYSIDFGQETDPTVPAHVKGITSANIVNWNEAYGWGDHELAGYLLASNFDAALGAGLVQLRALHLNAISGFASINENGSYQARSISGAQGEIQVQNGDGREGNPTVGLVAIHEQEFVARKAVVDTFGRVISSQNLLISDIQGLSDGDGKINPNAMSTEYAYPIRVLYDNVDGRPDLGSNLIFNTLPTLSAQVNQPISPYVVNLANFLISTQPASMEIKFVIMNPKSAGFDYTVNGLQLTITGTPTQETIQSVIAAYVTDNTGNNTIVPIPTLVTGLPACDRAPTILSVDSISQTSIRVLYDAFNVFVMNWQILDANDTVLRNGQLDYSAPTPPAFPPTLTFASLPFGGYKVRLIPVSCTGASSTFAFQIQDTTGLPACPVNLDVLSLTDIGINTLRLSLANVTGISTLRLVVKQGGSTVWETTLSTFGSTHIEFSHSLPLGSYDAEVNATNCTGNTDSIGFTVSSAPPVPGDNNRTANLYEQTTGGKKIIYAKAPDFDIQLGVASTLATITDVTSGLNKTGVWRDPNFGNKYVYYYIDYAPLHGDGFTQQASPSYIGLDGMQLRNGTYTIQKLWTDFSSWGTLLNNMWQLTQDNSKLAQITLTIQDA